MESSSWGERATEDDPYRSTSTAPRRTARRHAPLSGRELAIAVAIVLVVDASLFGVEGFGTGGFGLALILGALPALLFLAARRRRSSVRLFTIVALLALVSLRSLVHPTTLTTLAGLALLVPFAAALRGRRLFVPESALSCFASALALPSRLVAVAEGLRVIALRSRLGSIALAPLVVPLALSVLFIGVFSLANPVLGGCITAALRTLVHVEPPHLGRLLASTVAFAVAIALLRPALRLPRAEAADTPTAEASQDGLALARNVLVCLNLVFAAYHALDATYLWSGQPPEGMTTQRYEIGRAHV
jgi:hypothetical protein